MEAQKRQLQAFLAQVRKWEVRIKKTTFADRILFSVDPATAEFTLVVEWTTRTGEKGRFLRAFTRELVFGSSLRSERPVVQKRVCAHVQEFMQDVLHSRGV
jgi:hypothetical protein